MSTTTGPVFNIQSESREVEENEIAAIAAQIENDPDLASYREVSDWADAHAVDTLARTCGAPRHDVDLMRPA